VNFAAEQTTAVAVDVTFLRMDRRPADPAPGLPPDFRMAEATRCTVGFYRYLYDTVGYDYVWWLRRTVPDAELAHILADPGISVHVLYRDGEPAGFYEMDRRNRPLVNLSYFGLLPHAVGAGVGRLDGQHPRADGEYLHGRPSAGAAELPSRRIRQIADGAGSLACPAAARPADPATVAGWLRLPGNRVGVTAPSAHCAAAWNGPYECRQLVWFGLFRLPFGARAWFPSLKGRLARPAMAWGGTLA
jgi:hypothetical protein